MSRTLAASMFSINVDFQLRFSRDVDVPGAWTPLAMQQPVSLFDRPFFQSVLPGSGSLAEADCLGFKFMSAFSFQLRNCYAFPDRMP